MVGLVEVSLMVSKLMGVIEIGGFVVHIRVMVSMINVVI